MRGFRWVLAALVLLFVAPAAAAADLAIVHAKVYPSPEAKPIADGTVVMRDGKIIAVGQSGKVRVDKSAEVIDGSGMVVVAGFWNSHVHLLLPAMMAPPSPDNAAAVSGEMEAMLTRWGFTSVFDISSMPGQAIALRKRVASGEVRGPNILTVDAPFFPDKGTPIYVRDRVAGPPAFEIKSPAAGAERARKQIEAGADGVKIFAGAIVGPPIGVLPMPLDVAKAVAAEAHRAGKPVFAHPTDVEGLNVAIDSGVDILAHATPDSGLQWTPDIIRRLKARKMALIPTMTLWKVELQRDKAPEDVINRFVATAQQQLKAYSDAGGEILFGTDVGYIDTFDTTDEYRLMAGAGLTWKQILASLTTAPAKRFGFSKKGRVAKGMDADLAVLSADPAADPEAFARVAYTIRGGEVIYAAKR